MLPRVLICLCFSLALAGCVSRQPTLEAQAPKDDAECKAMGYRPGTEAYLQCRQLLMNQHTADAQAAEASRQSIRDRLQRASAALQSVSPPPPAVRTTNCVPMGAGVSCTSY